MAGSGFDNDVLNAIDMDFRQTVPVVGQFKHDGFLPIGSSVAPYIRAALPTSIGGTIAFTFGNGTINMETVGGQAADSFPTNSGTATPVAGVLNLLGSGSLATSGAGNTATFQLSGLTNHNVLVGGGSATITKVPPVSAGYVLTDNGVGFDPSFQPAAASGAAGSGFFGDGSDGALVFDGSSVVLGLTPSSSIYTMARDIFGSAITINNGVTIIPNGYKILCSGILTNNGTISYNGNNGTNTGIAGDYLSNANSSIHATIQYAQKGGAGNTGNGSSATGLGASDYSYGGNGGSGGAGLATTGGSHTANYQQAPASYGYIGALPQAAYGVLAGQGVAYQILFGGGGGGGGGDAVNKGGGGGGGGGIVLIVALTFAGTGNIKTLGGNGGAGAVGGNCGGGGGAGGGLIIIISRSVSAGAISGQTISAAGGTGGTATGLGSNGNNGSSGIIILLPN